jgi:carbon-monoxide dehydrogenase small subunit
MSDRLTLSVNDRAYGVSVPPSETLLETLRNRLGLTGTKCGCDNGSCGACTVLLDDEPVLSCLVLAVRCEGRTITTIEGLAKGATLHPLQQAAVDHGAVQCGYCTPGWLLTAKALLDRNPAPSREEVRVAIAGHLCRCTGYQKIEDCIMAVAGAPAHETEVPATDR